MDGKHRIPGAVAEEVGRQEGGLCKEKKRESLAEERVMSGKCLLKRWE